MKISMKQRIRSWLMDDADEAVPVPTMLEEVGFAIDGIRLQVYKASGGFVVETRNYDRVKDRHNTSMHIVTDEEDLGERLGKIVMMEALRG